MGFLNLHKKNKNASSSNRTSSDQTVVAPIDAEKREKDGDYDDSKVPFLTARTFVMAILAAMGGFIFGYDTGQISGFLEMPVFLAMFGEVNPSPAADDKTPYYFTNVRSGLIVAL
jgi:SP family sugar:H+ symporter-like MFS transporter